MIDGAHVILHSRDAEADREFLRESEVDDGSRRRDARAKDAGTGAHPLTEFPLLESDQHLVSLIASSPARARSGPAALAQPGYTRYVPIPGSLASAHGGLSVERRRRSTRVERDRSL
jgi:hypothetical protein